MARILFVGLGVMGAPMARHLARAGHDLLLFSRSPEKAAQLAPELGALAVTDLSQVAAKADVFITCVGDDSDVEGLALTVLPLLPERGLFIDHTTTSAGLPRRLAERHALLHVVDAPVSGGQAGAEAGTLSAMCGGSAEAFAAARPIMAAYTKIQGHVGPAGHGQLAKMVNQIAIAGVLQGLSEALAFGQRAGLDMEAVLEVVSRGAAQSWQMDNRSKTMLEGRFNFGFAVDLMRKDLGLVLAEARANGACLPLTALVDQFYADVQAMGGHRQDTSSLIRRLL